MTSRGAAQCGFCAHWVPGILNGGVQTCSAFPEQIPGDVWWNRVDHRDPIEGDNGIRWDPRKPDSEFPDWAMQATAKEVT